MAIRLPPAPPLDPSGFSAQAWQQWFDLLQQTLVQGGIAILGAPANFTTLDATVTTVTSLTSSGVVAANSATVTLTLTVGTTLSVGTDLTVVGKFGCNGKAPQAAVVLPANAVDLPTAIALANGLKAMSVANGTGA